ncbi:unnamed protein product [Kuraishia capsulata CBS 1993]|uniref:Ketoreductase (KR) domain-containing protein n=1 Tax=Kuraishia capsulata CBS 1993 TaxID=1382522 RepID=W6MNQ1_9ASCO|nr:uncharacterized protein KUCA_T00004243001 [Kuraishia capsulata CBS 1993]CDK28261.1 unnamed protein product [Kuraishia capsulata CBS 1993]
MKDTVKGSTVIIIGASSGIGRGVAEAVLTKDPAHLVVVSLNPEKNARVVAELSELAPKTKISGVLYDLTDDFIHGQAIVDLLAKIGVTKVNHLVYTATDPIHLTSVVDADIIEATARASRRVFGPLRWIQALFKYDLMAKDYTSSVTLASGTALHRPPKDWTFIAAGGGSAAVVVRALAAEFAPVRFNLVTPGLVRTELWGENIAICETLGAKLPLKHCALPDEIAHIFLALIENTYITGSEVIIDGGALLDGSDHGIKP